MWIETSRGCPYDCQICNKVVHGRTFRPKDVARVIEEVSCLASSGVREFHIADDGFTTDMNRAEAICDEIISAGMDVSWSCLNGIRVDRVSENLLTKMRRAGCYRVSMGIESGSQKVLDSLGKGTTPDQIRSAVRWAKRAGLETFGFFMFGNPGETEDTMKETIDFACTLPLDLAKASIVMPFPGSPLHDRYSAMGLILPQKNNYRDYNVYGSAGSVYRHPSLPWELVEKYQKAFYRAVYLRPGYMARRLAHSVRTGSLFADIIAAAGMKWFG